MKRRQFIERVGGAALASSISPGLHAAVQGPATRRSLATLAPGHARNLGSYTNPDVAGGHHITDFSGLVADAAGHRMLIFGGGHGPCNETDIRAFDTQTASWSSLYPSTRYADMTPPNCDSDLGRWKSTNHAVARHTYNLSVVRRRKLHIMSAYGMPYLPEQGIDERNWGGRLCAYDFDARNWSFSRHRFAGAPQVPWGFTTAAVLDPVSATILVVGYTTNFTPGNVWRYAPDEDTITPLLVNGPDVGAEHDIVYFAPADCFFVMQSDGRVWQLTVDRSADRATLAPVEVSGAPPASAPGTICAYGYDPANGIIGGNVTNGIFHAFDPLAHRWSAEPITLERGSTGVPQQVFHCLDFDASTGCFIFLSDARTATTWAYRPQPRRLARSAGATQTQVADLSLTLDFGQGSTAVFRGDVVKDVGDYVGEFVRQKCYLATHPDFPDWRVYFRVDADASSRRIVEPAPGWRDEVVVEYGRSRHGVPAHREQRYTATVRKADRVVSHQEVPRHWWYARWRYQSSERALVRTPEILRSRGWIANLGASGLFGLAPNTVAVPWGGPMSAPARPAPLYAFNPGMASGGDNPQIGYLTEYAADYVLHGSPASLVSLRTEGEWCGNWCMHIRDDDTGAPLDVRGRALHWRSNHGTINEAPERFPSVDPTFVALDTAHFYPCANLPWLLTDDPFHLESLQFGVNWNLLYNYGPRINQKLEGLLYPGQTRAYAWGLRQLFLLAATCPAEVPSWLLPRRTWLACVDDNHAFAMRYVQSPARIHALFRAWTQSDLVGAWQVAWLNTIVGLAVDQGFEKWQRVFEWGVDLHIKQTNGKSGWSRQWPVPYYAMPNRKGYGSWVVLPYTDTSPDSTTCGSWADFWRYYASGSDGHTDTDGHKIDTTNWDGRSIMQQYHDQGPSYLLHLRSVLAMAVTRGIDGARECYDYIESELTKSVMPHFRVPGQARFSIDPAAPRERARRAQSRSIGMGVRTAGSRAEGGAST